jgi:hypothetical protein
VVSFQSSLIKGEVPRLSADFNHPLSYERPLKFPRHLVGPLGINSIIDMLALNIHSAIFKLKQTRKGTWKQKLTLHGHGHWHGHGHGHGHGIGELLLSILAGALPIIFPLCYPQCDNFSALWTMVRKIIGVVAYTHWKLIGVVGNNAEKCSNLNIFTNLNISMNWKP